VKIGRLSGSKNFVRNKFVLNSFSYLKPVKRSDNGSDTNGSVGLNNSTSKRVLNLLEPINLNV